MILNTETVDLIKTNAERLARAVGNKENLVDFATAHSYEQFFSAIETILTNTEMYFDDDLLVTLNEKNWESFRASLLVYTLNIVNRHLNVITDLNYDKPQIRESTELNV